VRAFAEESQVTRFSQSTIFFIRVRRLPFIIDLDPNALSHLIHKGASYQLSGQV
jgi:hypothetical protein